MQFEFTPPQTELEEMVGGHYCINAFGRIEQGDGAKFKNFLEQTSPPPRTHVYINSGGGNVDAAMEIGRLIRDSWFSTSIGQHLLSDEETAVPMVPRKMVQGKCISAATLTFLGGRLRYFPKGSEFGVHQFSFKDPSPNNVDRSQTLSASIANYVVEMGIGLEFLSITSAIPNEKFELIELEQLQELNVVTGGITDVCWTVQARGGGLYVRGERDSLFGHHKVMLRYARDVGFLFHAVIESQGREQKLTEFGLVEIVVNGEDERIDISNRCQRMVCGIYVNVLARITDKEAQLLAHSDSFGIQIRFSSNAPMFLGIAAMSTGGGKEQLQVFYDNLRENK